MNAADDLFWAEDPLPVPEREPRMLFIGIDPGVSGGIAIISEVANVVTVHRMPDTDRDLFDIIKDYGVHTPLWLDGVEARAVLERAGASPQMGVTSAFTFGRGYGLVRMALVAAGIPFDVITAGSWQKTMQCRSGGDKNVTKARAQQLFPGVKVTHAIADALLLAEFGRRMFTGARFTPRSVEATTVIGAAIGSLLTGAEHGEEEEGRNKESEHIHIPPGFYSDPANARRAEAVAQRRRARADRRRDSTPAATATPARRRRGSGLEAHRQRRLRVR